jgi:hypothetical protein
VQTSPESPKIFALLLKLFTADPPETLQQKAAAAGVTAEDFEAFMQVRVLRTVLISPTLCPHARGRMPPCSATLWLSR